MKKLLVGVLIIFTMTTAFIVTTYSKEINLDKFVIESKILSSETLSKKLVRFHVIANSDAQVDQSVKLKVKDAVLQDMVPKLNVAKSKEETIKIINENSKNIKEIAEETLRKNNMSNDVRVVLNTTFFPTKYYKEFSLPAGEYLALRVIIGNGEGKNWWCVLFPPLCLVDVKREEPVKSVDVKVHDPKDKLSLKEGQLEEDEQRETGIIEKEEEKQKEKDPVDVEVKIDENTEKENRETKQERPQIRWKSLELLGFYKGSQF